MNLKRKLYNRIKITFSFNKKEGVINNIIPLLLAILVCTALSFMTINWTSQMTERRDIDSVLRTYILRMESRGYLSEEDKTSMIQELTDLGVTNITFGNTNIGLLNRIPYGEKICLEVYGKVKNTTIKAYLNDLFSKETTYINFHSIRTSTSKW